jgi:hypothetical protein
VKKRGTGWNGGKEIEREVTEMREKMNEITEIRTRVGWKWGWGADKGENEIGEIERMKEWEEDELGLQIECACHLEAPPVSRMIGTILNTALTFLQRTCSFLLSLLLSTLPFLPFQSPL